MVAHARRSRRNVGIVDRLKEQAEEVTDLIRGGANAIKEQAAETAGELGQAVRGEAGRLIKVQKSRAASKIRGAGWAVHKGAQLLHAAKADGVAEYVDVAAQAVDQASKYLEENDLARIGADAGELARRYPAATAAGLLLIGLAIGRFVKAGQPVERPRAERQQKGDPRRRQRQRARGSRGGDNQ